jgi:NADH-quinone oxidoreductase subunit G
MAQRHPAYARIRQLAVQLSELTGAVFGVISEGANSAGLSLAGVLPYRGPAGQVAQPSGIDLGEMLASPVAGLLLVNVEPEMDCADGVAALNAVADANFVVALTSWLASSAAEYADIVLPIGTFAESSGTYVNAEGLWQSFPGVASPVGEARPAWKVLRVLGNLLQVPDCDYLTSEQVLAELRSIPVTSNPEHRVSIDSAAIFDISPADLEVPINSVDALVRRAEALQQTHDAVPGWRKTV